VAYLAEDGSVYFAIDRFPQYGRLSRLDTENQPARAFRGRLLEENAQDFALWKAAKAEDNPARRGILMGPRPTGGTPSVRPCR
jgi:cysteinyl-tRNA synthetase